MRAYLALDRDDLAVLAAGSPVTAAAFLAASQDEEDELAALEEAADHGFVAAAAEVIDPDGPVTLDDIESFHRDEDGTGHLAWYATQEIDQLLG